MNKPISDGLTRNQRYYRSKGREQIARRVAEWRKANPERAKELTRNYYARHREAIIAQKKEYFQLVAKPKTKTEAGRLIGRIRKENRRKAPGTVTKAEWLAILAMHGNQCVYCGAAGRLEMDHVLPLCRGGHHVASNIVPACKSCNSSRGARYDFPPIAKGKES